MHNLTVTDVRAVKGDSAFLIDDGRTAILYDTGFAFTGHRVAEKIATVLGERSLDYIFLTHSHYDHAAGSPYVKKRFPNAKVVAGSYAAKIFAKPTAHAVMRDLDQKVAADHGVTEYEDLFSALAADITVEDGDQIHAGDMTFTAITFPGHTRCSVGYYLAENKLLLGTETLGVYSGEDFVVPSYLIGYATALSSIEKAEALDIESVLIPHFGLIDGDTAAQYLKASRRDAVSTAEDIANILRNGGSEDDAYQYFVDRFFRGYIREIYPPDAMELNTHIMIDLIKKELL